MQEVGKTFFFSMTAPWSELDTICQKYLRTSNLVERLSSILLDLISKRLVQSFPLKLSSILITTNLSDFSKFNDGLERQSFVPVLSSLNAHQHLLMTRVMKFLLCHQISLPTSLVMYEGVPDEDGLLQAIFPAKERFRKTIRMTLPISIPLNKIRG